jgi:hypothetical protein
LRGERTAATNSTLAQLANEIDRTILGRPSRTVEAVLLEPKNCA